MSLAEILLPENRSPGLTASELERAQDQAGAAFPPDLAEFLMECLPVGRGFPDWRNNPAAMREWQGSMRGGFVADVHRGYWLERWGVRPDDPDQVRQRVIEILDAAPRLIPIYAHRGIPDEPLEAGNPVFSVYGPGVVVCGNYLEQYLRNEFFNKRFTDGPVREIRFWTALAWGGSD